MLQLKAALQPLAGLAIEDQLLVSTRLACVLGPDLAKVNVLRDEFGSVDSPAAVYLIDRRWFAAPAHVHVEPAALLGPSALSAAAEASSGGADASSSSSSFVRARMPDSRAEALREMDRALSQAGELRRMAHVARDALGWMPREAARHTALRVALTHALLRKDAIADLVAAIERDPLGDAFKALTAIPDLCNTLENTPLHRALRRAPDVPDERENLLQLIDGPAVHVYRDRCHEDAVNLRKDARTLASSLQRVARFINETTETARLAATGVEEAQLVDESTAQRVRQVADTAEALVSWLGTQRVAFVTRWPDTSAPAELSADQRTFFNACMERARALQQQTDVRYLLRMLQAALEDLGARTAVCLASVADQCGTVTDLLDLAGPRLTGAIGALRARVLALHTSLAQLPSAYQAGLAEVARRRQFARELAELGESTAAQVARMRAAEQQTRLAFYATFEDHLQNAVPGLFARDANTGRLLRLAEPPRLTISLLEADTLPEIDDVDPLLIASWQALSLSSSGHRSGHSRTGAAGSRAAAADGSSLGGAAGPGVVTDARSGQVSIQGDWPSLLSPDLSLDDVSGAARLPEPQAVLTQAAPASAAEPDTTAAVAAAAAVAEIGERCRALEAELAALQTEKHRLTTELRAEKVQGMRMCFDTEAENTSLANENAALRLENEHLKASVDGARAEAIRLSDELSALVARRMEAGEQDSPTATLAAVQAQLAASQRSLAEAEARQAQAAQSAAQAAADLAQANAQRATSQASLDEVLDALRRASTVFDGDARSASALIAALVADKRARVSLSNFAADDLVMFVPTDDSRWWMALNLGANQYFLHEEVSAGLQGRGLSAAFVRIVLIEPRSRGALPGQFDVMGSVEGSYPLPS